jgi:acyl carrier protein
METKEQIFQALKTIMIELFELEESDITLQSSLNDELDLDSIDAIDMVVKLQEMTGKKVKPEDFKTVRIVNDIVDVVYKLTQE